MTAANDNYVSSGGSIDGNLTEQRQLALITKLITMAIAIMTTITTAMTMTAGTHMDPKTRKKQSFMVHFEISAISVFREGPLVRWSLISY